MNARQLSNSGAIYRRLLRYVGHHWKIFAGAVVAMIIVALADLGFAALLKPITDRGLVAHDPSFLRLIPFLLVGVFVARGLAEFVNVYAMTWVGRSVVYDLRAEMFERLLVLPTRFYDENSSASLVSKLIYDVEQVAAASTSAIRILVKDTVTTIGLMSWMLWLNWRLTIVLLVLAPVIALVVRYAGQRFRVTSAAVQESIGEIADVAKEALQGNRIVKVFGGQGRERQNFSRVNNRNRRMAMKKAVVAAATVPLMLLVVGIGIAVIVTLATRQGTGENGVSAGTFISYLGSLVLMLRPIKNLARVNEVIQTGVAAAGSIFAVIDQPKERDAGNRLLDNVRGDIEFSSVAFSYEGADRAHVVDDVSYTIGAGETVALVGPSGGGKTTLVSLLLRLYPLTAGAITIDGINVDDVELESLRAAIAVVNQDTMLFDDTIANNIAYGRRVTANEDEQGVVIDNEALQGAAEAAHVVEFASQLPLGLDTPVGERGILLSGGQRQRIAIARALYRDAPILILDEATSALDNESEALVKEACDRLMRGRTTIVIAHRLSTVEHADRIMVLDRGRIVESGTHQALLEARGLYARLHRGRDGNEYFGA